MEFLISEVEWTQSLKQAQDVGNLQQIKVRRQLRKRNKALKVSMSSAYPSSTHMAFVKMIKTGLMKFLISQNTDGLHRKSGVPAEKMAELHGNTNREKCRDCDKEYLRDFRVRNAQRVKDHKTGRACDDPDCGGILEDTIINFGEGLPEEDLNNGFNHAS